MPVLKRAAVLVGCVVALGTMQFAIAPAAMAAPAVSQVAPVAMSAGGCHATYSADIRRCNRIPFPQGRAICYAAASARYAACLAGQ
jgi:hypothetical protein